MSKVQTVLGPVSPEELGTTLVHEHCVIGFAGWELDPLYGPPDRQGMISTCAAALEPAKALGLCTLIDATPPDLGRDVEFLKTLSDKTQIHIICSTGRYTEENGVWPYLKTRAKYGLSDLETDLYETFMTEITVGIGTSGVKAGVIKVSTGLMRIAPCEEAVLRAAARASRETGAPVITHTEDGTMGPEQARILTAAGADPRQIMIGHMCGNQSLAYCRDVLNQGVNIGFDRFGIEIFLPDETRIATLTALLQEGYAERIMLSQDHVGACFGRGGLWPESLLPMVRNWSYDHVLKTILPRLREMGAATRQTEALMVGNPRRLFGGG
jgi:phosphotriesterase-related protein